MSQDQVTEEELAAIQAVILMMLADSSGQPVGALRVREVWPAPSPWRWAGAAKG